MKLFRRQDPFRAAQWFARVRSGHFESPGDKAWVHWMDADARNSQAYENIELAWELCEELRDRPRIREMLNDLDVTRAGRRAAGAKARLFGWGVSWRAGVAVAALILVSAATALFIRNRPSTAEYATAVGEQRVVTLADNSTISLNTATRVQVRYSGALRRIELLDGEALFSVTKDSERPFEVHALRGTTTAVGTEFDVQIMGAAAAVSVLTGTVAVQATENPPVGGTTQISAGQAVDYTADGTTSAIRGADTNKVRAWQAHRIVFTDVSLADALTDYNRYIKIPIVIGNAGLATRHINGVFRIGDQRAFLDALEQGLHVTATQTDSGIVLQPR
jgi:transmembrane sensor